MSTPHYLRVTRALALVSSLSAPVLAGATTAACGGAVDTQCAGDSCSPPAEGSLGCGSPDVPCGTAPYDAAPPDDAHGGVLPYDAGPVIDAGIVAYDASTPDVIVGSVAYDAGSDADDAEADDAEATDGGEPDAIILGTLPYTDAGDAG